MEIKDLIKGSKLGIVRTELLQILYKFAEYSLLNNEGNYDWNDLREFVNDGELDVIYAYLHAGQAIHGIDSFGGGDTEAMNDIGLEINRMIDIIAKEKGYVREDYVYDGENYYRYYNPEEEEDDDWEDDED